MSKILSENWFSNWTYHDRYYLTGIEAYVLEYVNKTKANKLTIVDVGCSTGVALKDMVMKLQGLEICVVTIGIDSDSKVKEEAGKNLDHFINSDVILVNDEFSADIVICSKMALWIHAKRKHQIVLKCSSFLKKDGKLITDVDDYKKSGILEDLLDIFRYDLPPLWVLKQGFSKFRAYYRYRLHGHLRKKMKSFDKDEAIVYAEQVLDRWNRLRWDEKLSIKFEILILNIVYRIFPKKPRKHDFSGSRIKQH